MKRFLTLIIGVISSIFVYASDFVYVGSYIDAISGNEKDLILYYSGDTLDSLEIAEGCSKSNSAAITICGEKNIKDFHKSLLITRERYLYIDKHAHEGKFNATYDLCAELNTKNNQEINYTGKIKWPKVHYTGIMRDKSTDYETVYVDITLAPEAFYKALSIDNIYFFALVTEAYSFYGEQLQGYILLKDIKDYDQFTELVSPDNLHARIALKNKLLEEQDQKRRIAQ